MAQVDFSKRNQPLGKPVVFPEQTVVIQGVPEDRRLTLAAAIHVQSVDWTPVLCTQQSTLVGSVNFVADRNGPCTYVCYANYKDAISALLGMDSLERWLRDRDWGLVLTVYVKKNGADGVPPIGWRSVM
mmetsp:Transcript_26804/g.42963  ORF Transcript_26804/g.42963 Transcript_26804/m.42963 type:complete len:129 (+) Transcript_26804:195-581(+)|eukprot:CAMPEP_0179415916 /NCGR_PEP_ID=MMETSP0799-20121207/6507_1 /TAXON_ID=46947 /ORGANISM="Geminigera cryophila, Strain CCMP2564" /LENGTH=128 /DNA_ID=CAMNT_0021188727 /DNA_START=195 /DNA_END=581 /DNA_ORIENTATION=-